MPLQTFPAQDTFPFLSVALFFYEKNKTKSKSMEVQKSFHILAVMLKNTENMCWFSIYWLLHKQLSPDMAGTLTYNKVLELPIAQDVRKSPVQRKTDTKSHKYLHETQYADNI